MNRIMILTVWSCVLLMTMGCATNSAAAQPMDPESTIRALVRANEDKDMATLARFMAHDDDIVSYSIGGRKYIGWPELERDFQEEFSVVDRLEIPIQELKVWSHGDVAWFTMEVDYTRFVDNGADKGKTVLRLRESGVLEKRAGQWLLLSWHESHRTTPLAMPASQHSTGSTPHHLVDNNPVATTDLSGEWDIVEVDNDKHYKATLDKAGNGPYTQHGGRFVTTKLADRLWQGTWHQPGNDREGGFELLLSEDGTQAKGIWWYTRVGTQKNIPAREHGGIYQWKRLTPVPASP